MINKKVSNKIHTLKRMKCLICEEESKWRVKSTMPPICEGIYLYACDLHLEEVLQIFQKLLDKELDLWKKIREKEASYLDQQIEKMEKEGSSKGN